LIVPTRKYRMIDARQRAYLDAMDIGMWSLRESAPLAKPLERPIETSAEPPLATFAETPVAANPPGLKLGPGGGGILLVCAIDTDSASRLANDISRALGSVPVWAWPNADPGAVELAVAVEESLFTTVAIFGDELARQFFQDDIPPSLQSANLVLLPSMRDIQHQAEARRSLWTAFCRSGMVGIS
jgi:DNA polymerase III psi subunit